MDETKIALGIALRIALSIGLRKGKRETLTMLFGRRARQVSSRGGFRMSHRMTVERRFDVRNRWQIPTLSNRADQFQVK